MKKICKVLIVENEEGIRELLSDIFSAEGYHFSMAATAAEMRTALASDATIDIAIIDIHLRGGFDGMVLAQEATAQGLPVILASGDHARLDEIEKSGHRHIMKPLSSALDAARTHRGDAEGDKIELRTRAS
jgi:DNA-binding NtrC family response regulator